MKTNELRPSTFIGMNLKEDERNYFTVIEVGETMKCCGGYFTLDEIEEKRVETGFWDIELFEGIPLDKYWLEKFGFSFKARDSYRFPNGWGFITLGEDGWYAFYSGSGAISKTYYFVHELQNLYFALTGEELIYKK